MRVIKDGAGNVLQRFDYYPFGSESRVWTAGTSTPQSALRYRFGGKEIAGQKVNVSTGAPAAAAGSPYLDFGARVYDPRTAAWLSQDPLSEKYYSISPYAYCAGNPVNLVDRSGLWAYYYSYDGVLKQSGEKGSFDILFVMNEDGEYSYDNSLVLKDQTILESLLEVSDGRGLDGEALRISKASSKHADDVFRLFLFLSNNSQFEWAVHRKGNNYTIGTARSKRNVASAYSFGVDNPDASVHSHPGDKYREQTEAIESMGYDKYDPMGDWANVLENYYKTGNSESSNYVYFPANNRLYNVGVFSPLYIRTINSYQDFYFGTLNHR